MKKIVLIVLISVLSTGLNFSNATAENVCAVNDPTGTPLNIRTEPNGKIIGNLPNGLNVDIIDGTVDEKGNSWVKVGGLYKGKYQEIGWVFRNYLNCDNPVINNADATCIVKDPTGTPLNVRSHPNGKILQTLKNGTEVIFYEETTDKKGNSWTQIGGYENGRIKEFGWVFSPYLQCD